jgi:hypothetical protein
MPDGVALLADRWFPRLRRDQRVEHVHGGAVADEATVEVLDQSDQPVRRSTRVTFVDADDVELALQRGEVLEGPIEEVDGEVWEQEFHRCEW